MVTCCSILAGEIPETEKPARLPAHGVAKESGITQGLNKNHVI